MATTRKFGIISNLTGVQNGITVQSIDYSENVQVAQARGEKGELLDIAGYSQTRQINLTGLMDTAKGDPATAGSILTIDGKSYLIDSVSRRESNSSFVELTISARGGDDAEIYIVDNSSSSQSSSSSN